MYALIVQNSVSQYPYSIKSLKAAYPNVSFPRNPTDEVLNGYNVYTVRKTERPVVSHNQNTVEATPALENGFWTQRWTVEAASPEEVSARTSHEAEAIRSQRDSKLKESDWTQMPDCPLSDASKSLWAVYRQALRDITSQQGFPFDVVFPDEPE